MELITPTILKQILERSGVREEADGATSGEQEDVVGHGENYCSDLVRIRLRVRLASGDTFAKTLVLKVFLKDLDEQAQKEMKQFFANEITMYDRILNNMGDLAEKHRLPQLRTWPRCYFANTELVVLDDLKDEGFVVAPRHNGLKLEEALRVIGFIGRLHALSMVAEKRKLIDPHLIRRLYTWVQLDNWTSSFIKKALTTVGGIVIEWGNEWVEPGRKIVDYSHRMSTILNDLYMEEVTPKVVNHGDAWINNLMVKYDRDNRVESMKFVDFQNATYNSCGWDLVYFLYSSLQGQLLRSNYDALLGSYRREFRDTLKRLGEDPDSAPTLDSIRADVARLHPFCLTVSSTVMGVVFNDSDTPIRIDELVTNDVKLRALYQNDVWKSTMKMHIKYFQQQKLL